MGRLHGWDSCKKLAPTNKPRGRQNACSNYWTNSMLLYSLAHQQEDSTFLGLLNTSLCTRFRCFPNGPNALAKGGMLPLRHGLSSGPPEGVPGPVRAAGGPRRNSIACTRACK